MSSTLLGEESVCLDLEISCDFADWRVSLCGFVFDFIEIELFLWVALKQINLDRVVTTPSILSEIDRYGTYSWTKSQPPVCKKHPLSESDLLPGALACIFFTIISPGGSK